jgi:hypothetical protein
MSDDSPDTDSDDVTEKSAAEAARERTASTETRTVDIRSDEQVEADDELDKLLEQYERQKESDGPVDPNLQALAEKHEQTTNDGGDGDGEPAPAADADASDPETGETTVTFSEDGEVPSEDADFGPGDDDAELDPETVEEVTADDETKAKRFAELQDEGVLDGDDLEDAATTTATADDGDRDATAYGADPEAATGIEDVSPASDDGDGDDGEIEFDIDMEAGDAANYEDVLESGLFEDVDDVDPDEFDFDAQDVESASTKKDDKVINVNGVYVHLTQPEGDAFYNLLERAQRADSIEARHDLMIDTVVEQPTDMGERVHDWSGAMRAQLATECAIHSGLDEIQDFQ